VKKAQKDWVFLAEEVRTVFLSLMTNLDLEEEEMESGQV